MWERRAALAMGTAAVLRSVDQLNLMLGTRIAPEMINAHLLTYLIAGVSAVVCLSWAGINYYAEWRD